MLNNISILICAIIFVESNGDFYARNIKEDAAGVMQIRPIFVEDINRISGGNFSLEDRYNFEKSVQMARIYFEHYGKGKTMEQMARMWAGGPDGHTQECTKAYWEKVSRQIAVVKVLEAR